MTFVAIGALRVKVLIGLYFREKGYIPFDFNSMLISISLTCVSGDGYIQTERTGPPYDIYLLLYNSVILQFIRMVSIML